MTSHPRRAFVGALGLVLAGSLMAGCNGSDKPQAQPSSSANSSKPVVVQPAKVDAALLTGDVGTLSGGGASVTVLNVPSAPGLHLSMNVVRQQVLRSRAQGALPAKLQVSSTVFASSSKAVGVQVTAVSGSQLGTSSLVYDAVAQRAYPSAAIVQPGQWGKLATLAAQQDADASKAVLAAMAQPQWPAGTGPSLTFSSGGELLLTFPASTKLGQVVVPAAAVDPLLTTLGERVRAAAQYPTKFVAAAAPSAVDNTGDATGATPAGGVKRPPLQVGPDCRKAKCVALTFDDGPIPATADLLQTLTKAKVPASFFALGTSVDANPTLVTQEALAGMVVGSHNQVHNPMTRYTDEKLASQLAQSTQTIRKLSGEHPSFMRPPYGDHNKRVDAVIGAKSMAVAIWSVDTNDWQVSSQSQAASQSFILNNVEAQTGSGGVLLMHDIHANSRAAVPAVIEKLRSQGYTFVTLSELGVNDYVWGKPFCSAPAKGAGCG